MNFRNQDVAHLADREGDALCHSYIKYVQKYYLFIMIMWLQFAERNK